MHACACAYRVRDVKAHLARAASAGSGEAHDRGHGRRSAPTVASHRPAAAGSHGRERRVTCVGRSGRLERGDARHDPQPRLVPCWAVQDHTPTPTLWIWRRTNPRSDPITSIIQIMHSSIFVAVHARRQLFILNPAARTISIALLITHATASWPVPAPCETKENRSSFAQLPPKSTCDNADCVSNSGCSWYRETHKISSSSPLRGGSMDV